MSKPVSILLPVPPSTNSLFNSFVRNGKIVHVPTKHYEAWKTEAGFDLNTQHPPKTEGKVSIRIAVPATRHRDIDNYAKAILDLLVKHNRIDDDRDVFDLHIIKDMDARTKRVKVTIQPYEG